MMLDSAMRDDTIEVRAPQAEPGTKARDAARRAPTAEVRATARSSEHADPSTEHRTEAEIPTDMSKSVPVGSGRVKQDRKMGQPAEKIKKTVNFELDMGDTAGQVAVKVRNVEKAKVRVSQSARKKEDDTTEAEPQARFGARRAPPSQEALQNMMLGSDVRDNNIEVAPPQAIPRVAESKVRFNLHRARTMEDKTTEVAPPQAEANPRVT